MVNGLEMKGNNLCCGLDFFIMTLGLSSSFWLYERYSIVVWFLSTFEVVCVGTLIIHTFFFEILWTLNAANNIVLTNINLVGVFLETFGKESCDSLDITEYSYIIQVGNLSLNVRTTGF